MGSSKEITTIGGTLALSRFETPVITGTQLALLKTFLEYLQQNPDLVPAFALMYLGAMTLGIFIDWYTLQQTEISISPSTNIARSLAQRTPVISKHPPLTNLVAVFGANIHGLTIGRFIDPSSYATAWWIINNESLALPAKLGADTAVLLYGAVKNITLLWLFRKGLLSRVRDDKEKLEAYIRNKISLR